MLISFALLLMRGSRQILAIVDIGIHGVPEIGQFQSDEDVRLSDHGAGARGLVEVMRGGEIQAPA